MLYNREIFWKAVLHMYATVGKRREKRRIDEQLERKRGSESESESERVREREGEGWRWREREGDGGGEREGERVSE